jgi:hypothetical protein
VAGGGLLAYIALSRGALLSYHHHHHHQQQKQQQQQQQHLDECLQEVLLATHRFACAVDAS